MDAETLLDQIERRPVAGEQMSFEQLETPDARSAEVEPEGEAEAEKPSAPVTGRHQDVRLYLTVLLKTFVELTDAGLVRDAPFQVRLDDGRTFVPDIIFVAYSNFDRVHETHIEGPPDIAVEVSSPESCALDRGEKFVAYEAAGVREYWLIDPVRELVNLYHLGPDGYYDEFRPDTAGRLRSRVLKGFVLDGGTLWRRVLPTTMEIVEMVRSMLNPR